jgi:membrane protein DedA with SNARE-associated domain
MHHSIQAPRPGRWSGNADRPHTPLTERTGPWNLRLAGGAGPSGSRLQGIMGALLAGERGRRRAICGAALALIGVYSVAFVPAEPSLIGHHPVRLEALSASTAAMFAGGAFARVGKASLELALLAPFPTLLIAGPFLCGAGRLWGPEAAAYLGGRGPRGRRRADRAVRALQRYGSWAVVLAYVLPVPSGLIYAAAGWTGMRVRRFLLLDLIGTRCGSRSTWGSAMRSAALPCTSRRRSPTTACCSACSSLLRCSPRPGCTCAEHERAQLSTEPPKRPTWAVSR